jgi:hypothetical protein
MTERLSLPNVERAPQSTRRKVHNGDHNGHHVKKRLVTVRDQPLILYSNQMTSEERATGLEPATSSLGSEPLAHGISLSAPDRTVA